MVVNLRMTKLILCTVVSIQKLVSLQDPPIKQGRTKIEIVPS